MATRRIDMTFDEFLVALRPLQGVSVAGKLLLQRDVEAVVDDTGEPVGACSPVAGFCGPLRALDAEGEDEVYLRAGDSGVRLRRTDISAIGAHPPGSFMVLMTDLVLLLEVPSVASASIDLMKAGA